MDLGRLRELAAGRYWSEEDGRAALTTLEASGLTRVAFGRETGTSPQRLSWWLRRRGVAPEPSGEIEFVPVELAPRVATGAEVWPLFPGLGPVFGSAAYRTT